MPHLVPAVFLRLANRPCFASWFKCAARPLDTVPTSGILVKSYQPRRSQARNSLLTECFDTAFVGLEPVKEYPSHTAAGKRFAAGIKQTDHDSIATVDHLGVIV